MSDLLILRMTGSWVVILTLCIAVDLVTDNKDKDKLIVTKFHKLLRPSMELYSLRLPCTANGNANGTLPFSTKKHFDIHTQAKMWGNPSLLI